MIEFAYRQMTGKRAAQEDALDILRLDGGSSSAERDAASPLDPGLVLVVADGMGGHVGGRVASTVCVRAFLDRVRVSEATWDERLEEGLNAANYALRCEAESQPDLEGMGSTLIGAVISQAGLGWISIGDSALYHYRAGTLTRLNEDHSFGAYLDQQARDGLMTNEAAATDRRRNHLFYALLGDELEHYERFSGFRELAEGDLVLLASDGLKTLSDERLAEILGTSIGRPVTDIVAELLEEVEREGRDRQDNVSVIAARIQAARPAASIAPEMPPEILSARDQQTVVPPSVRPPPRTLREAANAAMAQQPRASAARKSTGRMIWVVAAGVIVALLAMIFMWFTFFRT